MRTLNEEKITSCVNAVEAMDDFMRKRIAESSKCNAKMRLWENTFIKKQIDSRGGDINKSFPIEEHIRGMIYAMLTNGAPWKRIVMHQDRKTGRFTKIDEIFHYYDPDCLLRCKPQSLISKLVGEPMKCGSPYTERQIKALKYNIRKLKSFQDRSDKHSIDDYYSRCIFKDRSYKMLLKNLSEKKDSRTDDKLIQMAEALNAEYLRNMGHDIAKPDRHICRILGSERLGCSNKKEAGIWEAMNIVEQIARRSKRTTAEVDYILWSYCANCFGQICTKNSPKCAECVAKKYCKRGEEK